MICIKNGDWGSAESNLKKAEREESDSMFTTLSDQLLQYVYMHNSEWEKVIEASSNNSVEFNFALAEALVAEPKEEYIFNANEFKCPITLSISGTPMVEVFVNGVKKRFWIDTGAEMSVLASDIAEECKVMELADFPTQIGTSTSNTVGFFPGVVQEFAFGDVLIKNHPVLIIDKKDLEIRLFKFFKLFKIDGIIGWNAIREMYWDIDYKNLLMTVKKPVENKQINKNFYWLGAPVVIVQNLQGQSFNFFLDTGANKTSLSSNYINKMKLIPFDTKTLFIGGAGGTETHKKIGIFQNIQLLINKTGFTFSEISANLKKESDEFILYDGIIGSDVALKGRMILDFFNGYFDVIIE